MNLYAESSAVVAWLLSEDDAEEIRAALAGAGLILASDLTSLECDRVLLRALGAGRLREAEAADRQAVLRQAVSHWTMLPVSADVMDRARRPFPHEPIRTLDAIHLASAVAARSMVPDLALLSLDHRVRNAARAMGFHLIPAVDGRSVSELRSTRARRAATPAPKRRRGQAKRSRPSPR